MSQWPEMAPKPGEFSRARGDSSVSEDVHQRSMSILRLAVWCGLTTGFAEMAILWLKYHFRFLETFYFHPYVRLGPHILWMVPCAVLLVFVIPGLMLTLLAGWMRRGAILHLAYILFAFLGFLSLLLLIPRLHQYALLVLAFGLAVQTARYLSASSHRFHAMVRRTVGWQLVLLVALVVTAHGWQTAAERRALVALSPAPPDAPNVLLITLDTVRAQSLSLYGHPHSTTPQLERFAQSGVRFDRALSTSSWTTPSHASMFTGRWPYELSAGWLQPLDATYPTLAEVLNQRGYTTAGFVANTSHVAYRSGLGRGFIHYEDFSLSFGELVHYG